MELREYANGIWGGTTLQAKLAPPEVPLTDLEPGTCSGPRAPGRPPELQVVTDRRKKRKIPSIEGMADPAQRLRILHGFANHELQAVELFAWALLKFPGAPRAFRKGLLAILVEEQKHLRLYLDRLAALGGRFGAEPLSGYFLNKAENITSPAGFCASVGLTFEGANLDHALEFAKAAREANDPETAAVLDEIHDDEVGHVRFGWTWLRHFKEPGDSVLDAYRKNVVWPLRPALARGPVFHPESRRQAGLDDQFIELLAQAERPAALYHFGRSGRSGRPGGSDGE